MLFVAEEETIKVKVKLSVPENDLEAVKSSLTKVSVYLVTCHKQPSSDDVSVGVRVLAGQAQRCVEGSRPERNLVIDGRWVV